MTTDPEVLGAFSADDPLEARVGILGVMLGRVSRESEISLGEKNPKGADFGLSLEDPNILLAKAKQGQGWGIRDSLGGAERNAKQN